MRRRIVPRHIQIDASAHCQLACQSCPTASGAAAAALGAGHLDPRQFEALLDANPGLREVELSNYGEMFLNPRLAEILRIAWERKVALHADNGVNLNFASEPALDALVRYACRSLTCSIDGASAGTYRQYRVNGDFDRVLGHIRRINQLKRERHTGFPFLRWQFIVFGHNQHEIGAARRLAAGLDMKFYPKIPWDDALSPIRDGELVRIEMGGPAITRAEYHRLTGRDYMRGICTQLWRAPVLNWDGRVTGCCRNFWGEFGGNAFTDGLDAAVNGERIARARDMLMGRAPGRGDLPCDTCDLYHTMRRDRTWLAEEEVAEAMPPILCSIVPVPRDARATHVDVSLDAGHDSGRGPLARRSKATRIEIGRSFAAALHVGSPGPYTLRAVPRRMDPEFRAAPEVLPESALFIQVEARPMAQEFRIEI